MGTSFISVGRCYIFLSILMQLWTGPCWAMLLRAQRWMTIHQVEQVVPWMANFGLNPQPTKLMTTRGGRCAWLSQSGWPMWKSLTSIAIKVCNSCFVSREPLIIRKITWSAVYNVRSWYCYKNPSIERSPSTTLRWCFLYIFYQTLEAKW